MSRAYDSRSGDDLIFAFDIGATKSKALLTPFVGKKLASCEGQGFNLRQKDHREFLELIDELTERLNAASHIPVTAPSIMAMGIAGAGSEKDRNSIRDILASQWSESMILVHHDAFISHYGAFGGHPGVIVTSGTGSIAYGRNEDGDEERAGGWGWVLGDEGSGWWIGREAIRALLYSSEGGPDTVLRKSVLEEFAVDSPHDLLTIVYNQNFERTRISDLSPLVTHAAAEGDPVSRKILYRAGRKLSEMAIRVARNLHIPPGILRVALAGSVCDHCGADLYAGFDTGLDQYNLQESARTGDPGQPDPRARAHRTVPDPGPFRVTPRMNAVHGAAQWARDTLLERRTG